MDKVILNVWDAQSDLLDQILQLLTVHVSNVILVVKHAMVLLAHHVLVVYLVFT